MSTFEDYNTTCNGYDDNRQPLGADIVAGMMHVYNNKPLKVNVLFCPFSMTGKIDSTF
jgi:hypothetical protein